jgi:TPR repeat protein
MELFSEAAKVDHPEALDLLGLIYLRGKAGIAADVGRGHEYLLNAAEQGYPPSCCNLGQIYLKGTGVEQDIPLAIDWFRKGADQGYADAQYYLSMMYIISP